MSEKRYVVKLTKKEMVALWIESCCYSNYEDHSAASGILYRKLKQIGYFKEKASA